MSSPGLRPGEPCGSWWRHRFGAKHRVERENPFGLVETINAAGLRAAKPGPWKRPSDENPRARSSPNGRANFVRQVSEAALGSGSCSVRRDPNLATVAANFVFLGQS